MIPPLPNDIARISSPLIEFCGDTSLAVFIADRFFRDGSAHYNMEFLDVTENRDIPVVRNPDKDESVRIMKSSWYYKHSHTQPAICIFCVSIDINKLAVDRTGWLQTITDQLNHAEQYLSRNKPAFISIFVCPGNRDSLNRGKITEDVLIREYLLFGCLPVD